jgi:hypothetical protein
MSKVIAHPLLVRPSTATRGLIGVVPNQIAAAYNPSSCQVRMSNVKTRPLMFQLNWDPDIKGVILLGAFGNLPWKSRNILVQNE